MRWQGRRQSENVEDRRDEGGGAGGFGTGGIRLGGRGAGLGIGGTLVVLALALVFGIDPRMILDGSPSGTGGYGTAPTEREVALGPGQAGIPQGDEMAAFVSVVLADTEDVWNGIFRKQGQSYAEPTLVLFSGRVDSGCGSAEAAMGPFYCPLDQKLYIDLSFYRELRARLGAPGDFAQAYVIAHEVGHHVQTLLGISQKVQSLRRQTGGAESNALSVRLELQADCFAGIWAHYARSDLKVVEPGDIAEAMTAAAAVGDDRLQSRAGRPVVEESFTHGSSAQRQHWFQQGLESGRPESCDTFARRN